MNGACGKCHHGCRPNNFFSGPASSVAHPRRLFPALSLPSDGGCVSAGVSVAEVSAGGCSCGSGTGLSPVAAPSPGEASPVSGSITAVKVLCQISSTIAEETLFSPRLSGSGDPLKAPVELCEEEGPLRVVSVIGGIGASGPGGKARFQASGVPGKAPGKWGGGPTSRLSGRAHLGPCLRSSIWSCTAWAT